MNSKQRRTLQAVYETPERPDIAWSDIESLLKACGAVITEGRGSRVRISLRGQLATFHRPHPQRETEKGAVRAMRRFLEQAGISP
ncbi:MAG TPA: type II toxin-antitoxin system HicA family toxin [Pantanalinema sp.]